MTTQQPLQWTDYKGDKQPYKFKPESDTLIARSDVDTPVLMYINSRKRVCVEYGAEYKEFTKSDFIRANQCFGYAVRHAAECAGLLD